MVDPLSLAAPLQQVVDATSTQATVESWLVLAGLIGSAATAVHRWVVRPLLGARDEQRRVVRELAALAQKMDDYASEAKARNDKLESRLIPNGGASLYDAVERVERGLEHTNNRIDAHMARIAPERPLAAPERAWQREGDV